MLSVRLPSQVERELTRIAEVNHTTKTQIVRQAITDFLSRRQKEQSNTPYLLGQDLFGVYAGDEDLSQDYKNRLNVSHSRFCPPPKNRHTSTPSTLAIL